MFQPGLVVAVTEVVEIHDDFLFLSLSCCDASLLTLLQVEVVPLFIRQDREQNLRSNEVRRFQNKKSGGRQLGLPLR